MTQQAGQDPFSHLRPLLPGPPGQNPQQVQDQFTQLATTREQHQSKGDITGKAPASATSPNPATYQAASLNSGSSLRYSLHIRENRARS